MNEYFSGFTKESLKFFSDLEKNNSKSWFEKYRHIYNNEILIPAKAFVNEMGERLESIAPGITADARTDKSIFRIHRDIRFSKDKVPYKTHLGIWLWEGKNKKLENPGFYFQFDKESMYIGVGMYRFSKDNLKSYRNAVVDSVKGKKLIKAINRIHSLNPSYILGWKHYKKIPKGYDKYHPITEYLLYGGLGFQFRSQIPGEFYSDELLDYTYKIFNDMSPIHYWLREM